MSYKLYLDDIRNPRLSCEWVICRTVDEAIQTINLKGLPEFISFDHDLGYGQADGIKLAKWLVNAHLDERLDMSTEVFQWQVHSMNPVGGQNIKGLLLSFQQHLEYLKCKESGVINASETNN